MTILSVLIGSALDLAFGDPRWMPHPVVAMGRAISFLETHLRPRFPQTPKGEFVAGTVAAVLVPVAFCALCAFVLWACGLVSPWLRLAAESFACYQLLAACELRRQSMAVAGKLAAGDLPGARQALSMVVGRDTAGLDEAGVTRAAVETVAENASDGVVAPLLFMLVGGAPAGMLYKAVNTADSMVAYHTPRYEHYGKAAARMDDVANLIPARLTALLMVLSAPLVGLSARGAWRVWRRDRGLTGSPNAGQTESACAGALGVALGGDASYFGRLVHKPHLGDDTRPIEWEDVARANRLMMASAALALLVGCLVRLAILGIWGLVA